MLMRALVPVLAFLTLAACATAVKDSPPPPDPHTQMEALEMRITILVEEQRMKLDPKARRLAIDPQLAQLARARAADMAKKNYLAHTAPDGSTAASLLMKEDAKWQGLLGENLAAQHYTKQGGVVVNDYAQRFLDQWLKSKPHLENMVFANYDHAGVGAAVNADTVYVALLFSTDLGLPPPPEEGPANTATTFESPAAAAAAPIPSAPAGAPEPLRLRGATGRTPPSRPAPSMPPR
jgi:uncharacterized protein YkwD